MRQKLGEERCRWTHQVAVPRLSRVAFQSLLPQDLRQHRNHSMVAGEEGGGGPRRWGWAGKSREGRKWEGKGERKRREGRATPVCTSDCLGLASKNGRGGQGLSLFLHLTTSGPGSPAHSHKHMVSQSTVAPGNIPGEEAQHHKAEQTPFLNSMEFYFFCL